MGGLAGQRILLGVTGGIAAYKAADLARRLQEAGAEVQVVMTEAAQRFVTALTFQALTGKPVRTSLWDSAAEAAMGHIELARWASQILVAPASADFIARLAQGLASDLLGTLCLATEAPIAVVPAMNRIMWANPATQLNVETIKARGVSVLGPALGDHACGETGAGRMLEPMEIVAALASPSSASSLRGKSILISAGPTFEDLDPVRYLGNRSSGKMGFALAAEAVAAGATVTLVAGPVALATPAGVRRIDVRRAVQMRDAVLAELPGKDVYIGAAAIADYMPVETRAQKIKKLESSVLSLELVRTPDVLSEVARHPSRPRVVVGFAAETAQLDQNAGQKLRDKGADLIAGNDVSIPGIGFEGDENALVVFSADARRPIERGSKRAVARALLAMIAERLEPAA